MKRDLVKPLYSSFLSCGKDTETILNKLFVEDKQHARELKRLLIINTKDCLDSSKEEYNKEIEQYNVKKLIEENYIRLQPKVRLSEHEKIQSYIIMHFDNFSQNFNNEFRDCYLTFDILCNTDHWQVGNYNQRPLMICGYIDGMLNKQKLSGIGTLQFFTCGELILDNQLSGYTLSYKAIHGTDDILEKGQNLDDLNIPTIPFKE